MEAEVVALTVKIKTELPEEVAEPSKPQEPVIIDPKSIKNRAREKATPIVTAPLQPDVAVVPNPNVPAQATVETSQNSTHADDKHKTPDEQPVLDQTNVETSPEAETVEQPLTVAMTLEEEIAYLKYKHEQEISEMKKTFEHQLAVYKVSRRFS
jgi:hypothetical protein